MPMSICGKVCVVIGSAIGLAIVLVVAKTLVAGFELDCPLEIQKCSGENQLYHLPTQQCLQNGESNGRICGSNMVISPLATCRIQGECECDYEKHERHLVYDDETDQCYPIYSQGPCEDGFVVVISADAERLKCKQDACIQEKSIVSREERDSIVPYKNKCYTLSVDLDEPGCKGELKFWRNQMHPSCSPPPNYDYSMGSHNPHRCRPGSMVAFYGRCQPSGSFSFRSPSRLDDDFY